MLLTQYISVSKKVQSSYSLFRANRIILLSDFSISIRYPYCFNCVTILRTYMIGTESATLGEKDRDVQIESSNHIRQV